jgi:hypothetical protein
VDAVRARARRGLVEQRKGNDGRISVRIPAGELAEPSLGADESPPRLRQDLDEARAEAEHWRQRTHEVELRAAKLEGQVEAARAVAVADVATARAEIEAKERYIEKLEELLAEARKPWWRRWR